MALLSSSSCVVTFGTCENPVLTAVAYACWFCKRCESVVTMGDVSSSSAINSIPGMVPGSSDHTCLGLMMPLLSSISSLSHSYGYFFQFKNCRHLFCNAFLSLSPQRPTFFITLSGMLYLVNLRCFRTSPVVIQNMRTLP